MGIRKLRLAAATCALITMSGCTTSDGSKPSKLPPVSNSASASTSSAPKLTAEQEAIVSQYKAYFNNFIKLVGAPKVVVFDELTKYAYPAVVEVAYAGLKSLSDNGKRAGGTIIYGVLEPEVDGKAAKLVECRDTTTETIVSTADGSELTHGSPGARFIADFELDSDGKWRVTLLTSKEKVC